MHDEQKVQSEHSQKGPEDVVKLLIGVGQMVWFGYKGKVLLREETTFWSVLEYDIK